MSQGTSIQQHLTRILPRVTNPGRYIGGEANQVKKSPDKLSATLALVFPDTYELGMSHNGTKVLYHIVNREEDLAAERAFAPWQDMADEMRNAGVPLYSLESYRPVREFSALGFSLQTELNYTNIPFLLELAGLSAFACDRSESDPIVMGGGPCMANPEPVADFFDLFLIGDGECITPALLRLIGRGRLMGLSKKTILERASLLRGVYVPTLQAMAPNQNGEMVPPRQDAQGPYLRSKGVRRTWVETLDKENYPVRNLIPNLKLTHDRFSVEVMRGCTQGCRFCQAGYWYRPNRELNPDAVIDLAREGMKNTGERELGLLSLSTADYGPIESVTDYLVSEEEFQHINLSLPSLRADSFGQGLAQKASLLNGGKSATFAPETGSERLRRLINKNISDEAMVRAAESVFGSGYNNIKLYTMVGIPTENIDDMRAFCGLIEKLVQAGKQYGSRKTVHANIGIMIPKPFTPMQWVPFMDQETVEKHIRFVRNFFRGHKNVRITWADYGLAEVEAFYSRGDRSLAPLIYEAYQRGAVFESYSESFSHERWREIWSEFAYPVHRFQAERDLAECLPWDYIHAGANKGFLKREYHKMFQADASPVPDCKWGECQKCGIPGNGTDTQLAAGATQYVAESKSLSELQELAKNRKQPSQDVYSYLVVYTKQGLSRFLSHHITLSQLERALRRLAVPLRYSQGFSPRPVMKNPGALPLGVASDCEMVLFQTTRQLETPLGELSQRLSAALPEGMTIQKIFPKQSAKLPKIFSVWYSMPDGPFFDQDRITAIVENKETIQVGRSEKKSSLDSHLVEVAFTSQGIQFRLAAGPNGATMSPGLILETLLETDLDQLRDYSIVKMTTEFQLEPGRTVGKDWCPNRESVS